MPPSCLLRLLALSALATSSAALQLSPPATVPLALDSAASGEATVTRVRLGVRSIGLLLTDLVVEVHPPASAQCALEISAEGSRATAPPGAPVSLSFSPFGPPVRLRVRCLPKQTLLSRPRPPDVSLTLAHRRHALLPLLLGLALLAAAPALAALPAAVIVAAAAACLALTLLVVTAWIARIAPGRRPAKLAVGAVSAFALLLPPGKAAAGLRDALFSLATTAAVLPLRLAWRAIAIYTHSLLYDADADAEDEGTPVSFSAAAAAAAIAAVVLATAWAAGHYLARRYLLSRSGRRVLPSVRLAAGAALRCAAGALLCTALSDRRASVALAGTALAAAVATAALGAPSALSAFRFALSSGPSCDPEPYRQPAVASPGRALLTGAQFEAEGRAVTEAALRDLASSPAFGAWLVAHHGGAVGTPSQASRRRRDATPG